MTRPGYYSHRMTETRAAAIERLRIAFGMTKLHTVGDVLDMAFVHALRDAQPTHETPVNDRALETVESRGNPMTALKSVVWRIELEEREGRLTWIPGGASNPSRSHEKDRSHRAELARARRRATKKRPLNPDQRAAVRGLSKLERGAPSATGSRGKRGTRPQR